MKRNHVITLAFALLLFISLACGSSNEGTKITPAAVQATSTPSAEKGQVAEAQTPKPEATPTQAPQPTPTLALFQVGDLVQVKNHTIRLNSVKYRNGMLIANFSVENKGDSDLNISSLSFSAKKEDGTKLQEEIFDCDGSGLGGQVLPGDRLRGYICWSGAAPEDGIKIYYEASLFGRGAVVWVAAAGESEPEIVGDAVLKTELFGVGDVVKVKEHTIVLNKVTWQGNILQANFTVENQGNTEVTVSSLASFYARTRDGSDLQQEIFDCGSSLDGKVLPGDKLKGDICWSGANAQDGIRIYYQASIFGQGAVVWRVE